MISLKFEYESDCTDIINEYIRQYSSCMHVMYNLISSFDNKSKPSLFECYKKESDCTKKLFELNNVDLILKNEWLRHCCISEAYQLSKASDEKTIFGSKSLFIRRCKNKISRQEFLDKRKSKLYLYSIGTANPYKGNQKFEILDDMNILFKPNKNTHIIIKLKNIGRRINTLKKLFIKQNEKSEPITYKISEKFITISFDEKIIENIQTQTIKNRVLGIDLNPNYIGWSVVDWKSENEFDIIDHGVYSFKAINDLYFKLVKEKTNSNDSRKIHLNNKRRHETIQVAKDVFIKALHYKCQIISVEDLNIKSSDKKKGSKYNSLCNNLWIKTIFVNHLEKRCNCFNIRLLKVIPNYSSFIGNFLFKHLNLPDMVLASFELGRRAYEFNAQYVEKTKEKTKNIVQPNINKFLDYFTKSLEEFSLDSKFKDIISVYEYLKKSKMLERLSLDYFEINKIKFKRKSSMIYKLAYSL